MTDNKSFELNSKPKEAIENIEVPIKRTVAGHKYCCVWNSFDKNLIGMSQVARMQSYQQTI